MVFGKALNHLALLPSYRKCILNESIKYFSDTCRWKWFSFWWCKAVCLFWEKAINLDGKLSAVVTVTDGDLSDSTTFTVTVNSVNDAPVLDTVVDQSINEDGVFEYVLSASDVDSENFPILSLMLSPSLGPSENESSKLL